MQLTTINHQNTTALKIEHLGASIIRYGLAVVLIWIGIIKFTTYEAEGVKPLIEHSPLLSLFGTMGFSMLIGAVEILSGLLIALRSVSAKASVIGGLMGVGTFVITLTFLLSTPGVIQPGYSFPFISPQPGQFLIKDIVLLGASLWVAGEAWLAVENTKPTA